MSNIIGVRNNNTIVPYSAATVTPAGTIIAYSGSIAAFSTLTSDGTTLYYKDGWALCNGASISQTTYAQLYARIAATWNTATNPLTGSAQSAPTSGYFRIPNLQGTFLRGVGDFSDNTKDTTLAGFQSDQLQGHEHNVSLAFGSGQSFPAAYGSVTGAGGTAGGTVANYGDFGTVTSPSDDGINGSPRTGTETRSQNIGVYYLIKLYDNLAAVDVYIPPASATETGLVTTGAQTFGGRKSSGNSKVSAGMTNPQSIAAGASEINTYWSDSGDSNLFDTNNEFDTSTGRFTPTRAGYYQVNAYCGFGSISSGKIMELYIAKNNTTNIGKSAITAAITETYTLTASCLIYCNGTTDYISLRAYHNDVANRNVTAIMNISETI